MEPTGLQRQKIRHSAATTRLLPPKQLAGNISGKVSRSSSATKPASDWNRRSSSGNTTSGGTNFVWNNGSGSGNSEVVTGATAGGSGTAKHGRRRSIGNKSHGSGTLSSGTGGNGNAIGNLNGAEKTARMRTKGPSSSTLPAADPPGVNVRKLSSSTRNSNGIRGEREGGGRLVMNDNWKRLRRTVNVASMLRASSGGGGVGAGNHSRSGKGHSENHHGIGREGEHKRSSIGGNAPFANDDDDGVSGNLNASATAKVNENHAVDSNCIYDGVESNPDDAWKRLRHKVHVVRAIRGTNHGMRNGGSGASNRNANVTADNNNGKMVGNKLKELPKSGYIFAASPSQQQQRQQHHEHEKQQQLRMQRQYQLQPPQQSSHQRPIRTTMTSNHPRGVISKRVAPQNTTKSCRRIISSSSSGRNMGRHSENAKQPMGRGTNHNHRLNSINRNEDDGVNHINRKITPIDEDKEGVPEEEDDDNDSDDDETSLDTNDIDPKNSLHGEVGLDHPRTVSSNSSPVPKSRKNHRNDKGRDKATPTDAWDDNKNDQFQKQLQDQWRLLHLIQQQMGVERSPTQRGGEQDEDRAYRELCDQIKILQELQDQINLQKEKDRMGLRRSLETKYPDDIRDDQDWKQRQHGRKVDDGNTELGENTPPKPPFQKSDNDNLTFSTTSTEPLNSKGDDDDIYQVSPEIDDIDESTYPSRSSSPMRPRLSELSHALESDLETSLEVFEDDNNDDSTYEKKPRGFASSFPTIPGDGDFLMSDSSDSSASMSSKASKQAATVGSLSTKSASIDTCKLSPRTQCQQPESNSSNIRNQRKLSSEELMKVILDIQNVCNAAKDAVDSDPDTNSRSSDESSQSSSSSSTSSSASSDSSPITDHGFDVETVISDITNFSYLQSFRPGNFEASDLPIPSHIDKHARSKLKTGAVEFEEKKVLERQLRNPVSVSHKTSVYTDSDIESYTDRVVRSMRSKPPLQQGKSTRIPPKVSKKKQRKAKKTENKATRNSIDSDFTNEQDVESYTHKVVTSAPTLTAPKTEAPSISPAKAPKESTPHRYIAEAYTKSTSVYSVESYTDKVVMSMRAPRTNNAPTSSQPLPEERKPHEKETVSSRDPSILSDVESFTDRIVTRPRMPLPLPLTINTEGSSQPTTERENMDELTSVWDSQAMECASDPSLVLEESVRNNKVVTTFSNHETKSEKSPSDANDLVADLESAEVTKMTSYVSNDEEAIGSKITNNPSKAQQKTISSFEGTNENSKGDDEASKSSTIETIDPVGKLQSKKESFHASATDEESNNGSRSIRTDPTGALGYRNSFIYKVPKTHKLSGLDRSVPQTCALKPPMSDIYDPNLNNSDGFSQGNNAGNDDAPRSIKNYDPNTVAPNHEVSPFHNISALDESKPSESQHAAEQMANQSERSPRQRENQNDCFIYEPVSTCLPPPSHQGQNDVPRRFTISESSGASMQSSADNLDKTIYEPRQVDDTKFLELCDQWKMAHRALQYALGANENYTKHYLPYSNCSPDPPEELYHPVDETGNFGYHSVSDDKHDFDEEADYANNVIDQENEQDAVYIYVADEVSTTSSKVDGYAGTVISDITSFTQPFFSNSYRGYRIPGLAHSNWADQIPYKSHFIPPPGHPHAGSEDFYPAVANYNHDTSQSADHQLLQSSNAIISNCTEGESEITKIARALLNGINDTKPIVYDLERSSQQQSRSIDIPGGVKGSSYNRKNLDSSLNWSEGQPKSISQLLNDIADLNCSHDESFIVRDSHHGPVNSSDSKRCGDSSLPSLDPGNCGDRSDNLGITDNISHQRLISNTDARGEDLSKEAIVATSEARETNGRNGQPPRESQFSNLTTKAKGDVAIDKPNASTKGSHDQHEVCDDERVPEADAIQPCTYLDDIHNSKPSGSGNGVDHVNGSHKNNVEHTGDLLDSDEQGFATEVHSKDNTKTRTKPGNLIISCPPSKIPSSQDENSDLDKKATNTVVDDLELDETKRSNDGDNELDGGDTLVPPLNLNERSTFPVSSQKKESGWSRVRERVTYMDIINRMQAQKDSGHGCNSPVHSIVEDESCNREENDLNEDFEVEDEKRQQYSELSSDESVDTSYDNNGPRYLDKSSNSDDEIPNKGYQVRCVADNGKAKRCSTKSSQHCPTTNHKGVNSYLGAYLEGQHAYAPIYDRDDVSFATLQSMKKLYSQSMGNQESFVAKSRLQNSLNRMQCSKKELVKEIPSTQLTSNEQRNRLGSPCFKSSKSSRLPGLSKSSKPSKSSKLATPSKESLSKIRGDAPSESTVHEAETTEANIALLNTSSESSALSSKSAYSEDSNAFLRQIQHLKREVVDEEVLITAGGNKGTSEKNDVQLKNPNVLLDDDIEIKWDELKDPFKNDYELDHFQDDFSTTNSFVESIHSHHSDNSHDSKDSAQEERTLGWAKVREKVTYLDILNKMKVQGDVGRGCISPVHSVVGNESHRSGSFSDNDSVRDHEDDATSTGSPDSVLSWNQFEADNMQEGCIIKENRSQDDFSVNSDSCWHKDDFKDNLNQSGITCEKRIANSSANYPERLSSSLQVNAPLQDSTRASSGSLSGDYLVTSKPNRSRRSSFAPDNTSFFSIEMDADESVQTYHLDQSKASSICNVDELADFLRRHCAVEKKVSREKSEELNDVKSNCTPNSAESTSSGSTKGRSGPPTRSPSPDRSRVSMASFPRKSSTFMNSNAAMSRQIDYLLSEEEEFELTAT